MLPAGVPPRAGFDGNNNDAVHNRFRLLRRTHRLAVVNFAYRIAAVSNHHHRLPALSRFECL